MIAELRQYTLHPGKRDTLLELFNREFLHAQAECGMPVLGQFIDLDDPDRFVWFRGFESMERRKEALTSFYSGPVWLANRDAANATMIDSDDVLLLRHVEGEFVFDGNPYVITVCAASELEHARGKGVVLQSEHAENTYPRLPIREGEDVVVVISRGEVELANVVQKIRVQRSGGR
ncbi:MAG TPA: NIPSNAP family protein [Thermoanaerobaculia bacterium]|nr:NIPSNAP family protein [Thermoanaerobaculia bacterium]